MSGPKLRRLRTLTLLIPCVLLVNLPWAVPSSASMLDLNVVIEFVNAQGTGFLLSDYMALANGNRNAIRMWVRDRTTGSAITGATVRSQAHLYGRDCTLLTAVASAAGEYLIHLRGPEPWDYPDQCAYPIARGPITVTVSTPSLGTLTYDVVVEIRDPQNSFSLPPPGYWLEPRTAERVFISGTSLRAYRAGLVGPGGEGPDTWLVLDEQGNLPSEDYYVRAAKVATVQVRAAALRDHADDYLTQVAGAYRDVASATELYTAVSWVNDLVQRAAAKLLANVIRPGVSLEKAIVDEAAHQLTLELAREVLRKSLPGTLDPTSPDNLKRALLAALGVRLQRYGDLLDDGSLSASFSARDLVETYQSPWPEDKADALYNNWKKGYLEGVTTMAIVADLLPKDALSESVVQALGKVIEETLPETEALQLAGRLYEALNLVQDYQNAVAAAQASVRPLAHGFDRMEAEWGDGLIRPLLTYYTTIPPVQHRLQISTGLSPAQASYRPGAGRGAASECWGGSGRQLASRV